MSKEEIKENILESIKRNSMLDRIRKVSLFGSYLHGTAKDDSDVDLLVEFSEPIGFFDLVGIQRRIEEDIHKKVDLVTPNALSKYFRDEVINQAEEIYAKE